MTSYRRLRTASVHSDAEERILSTGLLTIRLERLIKRVLSSPLQREFLTRAELRVPKHLGHARTWAAPSWTRPVVTSPRGRRKIARHIEHALDGTADALVDRLQEAVWVVLFSRHQLQGLKSARRHTPVTATALVWYPGEPALYCSRPKPAGRLLAAVSAGLGFSEARPYPLSGRKLSTMRLMFTAKKSRRFHDCELPADEYPLEM
ncbi:hypothetical protein FJT64_011027 [Amphibalanus amphitrite]|uniref:Uncharacterized protein n=1 Tax=Amphibalanus amphitrite TaxID=1232801 RepID=A0A6A4VGS8_AMPAM|nr:hypothetical protein FJT64_011027 [Amphibalanus amphitrite]